MGTERRYPWLEVVLLAAIVAMIIIIAKPGILVSRRAVNESEAVGALRTLYTIEVSYNNRHPGVGYTCSLQELYNEGLIDSRLATGIVSGYRLSSGGCRPTNPRSQTITEYEWYADPVNSETGTRHFCTDHSKVIHASDTYGGHNCLSLGNPL